jgi:hypothetical protein
MRGWKWHHRRLSVLVAELDRNEYTKRKLLGQYCLPSKDHPGDSLIKNIIFGKFGLYAGKSKRSAFYKKLVEAIELTKKLEQDGHTIVENPEIKVHLNFPDKYQEQQKIQKKRDEDRQKIIDAMRNIPNLTIPHPAVEKQDDLDWEELSF